MVEQISIACHMWVLCSHFLLCFLKTKKIETTGVYSTSPPSGNQVDGLPLVLHNTGAVVIGRQMTPRRSVTLLTLNVYIVTIIKTISSLIKFANHFI